MPQAPPRSCSKCGKACQPDAMRNGRCPECAKEVDAAYDRTRKDDPIRQMYTLARFGWRKFRDHVVRCNPICQRNDIRNPLTFVNEQCHNPSMMVHHLISPRVRKDLFTTPSNVVALCDGCHAKTEGEVDGKRDPEKYVATLYGFAMTGGVKEVN
jgi:hypothetical protein